MADLLTAQILAKQQQIADSKSQRSLLAGTFPRGEKPKYREPLAPPGERYQKISPDVQFSAPQYEGEIAAPADVRYANLGKIPGQFVQSPSNLGGIVKEARAIDAKTKIAYKKGLTGQVDHIIPVWLGGSGTPQNLRLLTTKQHMGVVSKAQAAILALYRNPELSKKYLGRALDLPEARMWAIRAIDMKPEDVANIYTGPKGYEKGYIVAKSEDEAVRQAAAALQQWQAPPKVTFKDWWNELTHKGEVAGKLGAAGAVTGGLTAGPLGAGVGLAAGLGLGLGATDPEKTAKKIAEAMPDTPLGEFGKAAASGLYLGHVPVAHEGYEGESSITSEGARILGHLGGSLPWYISASHGVEKSLKALSSKVPALSSMLKANSTVGNGKLSVSTAKMMSALKEAGVFAGVGQMSKLEENESRVRRLMNDMLLGGTIGVVGLPKAGTTGVKYASELAKKSAQVGVAGFVISALEGADFQESLYNSLLLSAMHGMGGIKITPADLEHVAARAALEYRNRYGGLPSPEDLGIFPPPPPPGGSAIYAMPREQFQEYLVKLGNSFRDKTPIPDRRSILQEADTPENARKIMENIVIANRQIARAASDNPGAALEDMRSLGKRQGEARPTLVPDSMSTAWDAYARMQASGQTEHETYTPNNMELAPLFTRDLEFVPTGTARDVNPEMARAIEDAVTAGAKPGDVVMITRRDDPEFVKFLKAKAKEFPEDAERLKNPEESLQVSILQNGVYRPLGFVPGPGRHGRQTMEHPAKYARTDADANRHTMTAMLRDTGSEAVTGTIVDIKKRAMKSNQPTLRVRVEPKDWNATQALKTHHDLARIDRAREASITAKKLASAGSLVDSVGKLLDEAGAKERSGPMLTALNGSLEELHKALRTGNTGTIKEYFSTLGMSLSDSQAKWVVDNLERLRMKDIMYILQAEHANGRLSGAGADLGHGIATYESIMGDGSIYRSLGPAERKAFEDMKVIPPPVSKEKSMFAKPYKAKSEKKPAAQKAAEKAAAKVKEVIPEPISTQTVEEGGETLRRENLPDGRYWIEITATGDRLRRAATKYRGEVEPPIADRRAAEAFIKEGNAVDFLYRNEDVEHPLMARLNGEIMELPAANKLVARSNTPTQEPKQFFGPEAPAAVPEVPESMKKALPEEGGFKGKSGKRFIEGRQHTVVKVTKGTPKPVKAIPEHEKQALESEGKRRLSEKIAALERQEGEMAVEEDGGMQGAALDRPVGDVESPELGVTRSLLKMLSEKHPSLYAKAEVGEGTEKGSINHIIDMLRSGGSRDEVAVAIREILSGYVPAKGETAADIAKSAASDEFGFNLDHAALAKDAAYKDIVRLLPPNLKEYAHASGVVPEKLVPEVRSAAIKKFREDILKTLAEKPVDSEAFAFNLALDRAMKAVFEVEREGKFGPWKPKYESSWKLKPKSLTKSANEFVTKAGRAGTQKKAYVQARALLGRLGGKLKGKELSKAAARISATKELKSMGIPYEESMSTQELTDKLEQARLDAATFGPGRDWEGISSRAKKEEQAKEAINPLHNIETYGKPVISPDDYLEHVTTMEDARRGMLAEEATETERVQRAWEALKKALPNRNKSPYVVEERTPAGAGIRRHEITPIIPENLPEKPEAEGAQSLEELAKELGVDVPHKDVLMAEDAVRTVMEMAQEYNKRNIGKPGYVRPQFSNEVIVPAVMDMFKLPAAEKKALFEKAKADAKAELSKLQQPVRKKEFLRTPAKKAPPSEPPKAPSEMKSGETIDMMTPEFDRLPKHNPKQPTRTYAGIGSRETPPEVQKQMTDIAKYLSGRGYTLRSGGAAGADTAFEAGASKKEIFYARDATDRTRAIAKEIHPNPAAISRPYGGLDLHARNTNQVFGRNLDTPADFVLVWTKDGAETVRGAGGTGQAIDLARKKGIPVINMKNPGALERVKAIVESTPGEAPEGGWARFSKDGYEVSTHGDKRFSAFNAKLKDGKSIEEHYQMGVKGYPSMKEGKGKPPLNKMTREEQWQKYLGLWKQWAVENPELLEDLRSKAAGKQLTDKFANTDINQARALSELLQAPKMEGPKQFSGQMSFSYGENKRAGVSSSTTIDAVLSGERTATSRYERDPAYSYWNKVRPGDTINWKSGEKIARVVVTDIRPIDLSSPEKVTEWSKKEGWSEKYARDVVAKKGPGIQISFKLEEPKKGTLTMRTGRKLATEKAGKNKFWLQQNTKTGSFWAKLALKGHKVEHLMVKGGGYANRVRVDGKEYSYGEAVKKFR